MLPFVTSLVTYCTYALLGLGVPSVIIYFLFPGLRWDLKYIRRLVAIERGKKKTYGNNFTILDQFEKQVRVQGTKNFILFQNQQFTYSDVNKQANKIMNYLVSCNEVKLRDVVCLFMHNEPAFIWTWLGIGKCGATTSLLNINLRGKSLVHCIKISEGKKIICGKDADLIQALTEIKTDLDELGIQVFVLGHVDTPIPPDFQDLTKLAINSSDENNLEARKGLDVLKDTCVYIYTSGTTGLPKATRMQYRRMYTTSMVMTLFDIQADDVFYLCLPLYHSAAFGIGLQGIINVGATAALRKKFSVREFWSDVRQHRATIVHYIGETARYLVQAPRSDQDGVYSHGHIRIAVGNGMPSDIWKEFQERFNIQRICEFYGASEGNFLIANLDSKVGAVGRYSPLIKFLMKVLQVLECDMETAEPIRGPDGLCKICPKGKPGIMATMISARLPLDGYLGDKVLTEKKLIRNVLKKGDVYFNTGDLMMIDEDGYVYFKDRLGNTFRWKGENVATTEVELAILENKQIESANVYGVKIEGQDGRAGMASLVLKKNESLDCKNLYKHVMDRLPSYACPKFIRIKDSIEITGTYKHRKINLIKEGFDPRSITDPMFYMNDEEKTYSVLDEEAFNNVQNGNIRM